MTYDDIFADDLPKNLSWEACGKMSEQRPNSSVCSSCGAPFIEIDHYGEQLVGCLQCNRWLGSELMLIVELPDEDVTALRELGVSRP